MARQFMGIAPAPGAMQPGGGTTGAPLPKPVGDPTSAPLKPPVAAPMGGVQTKFATNPVSTSPAAPSAPGFADNPAARDVALRNLATSTAAAPTAAPAPGMQANGLPIGVMGTNQQAGSPASPPLQPPSDAPPAHAGGPGPQLMDRLMQAHPQAQQFLDAIHNATSPQDRAAAITSLVQNLFPAFQKFQQQGQQDDSEFGQHFDSFDKPPSNDETTQQTPVDDEQANVGRMRRARKSRTGIYTGANG